MRRVWRYSTLHERVPSGRFTSSLYRSARRNSQPARSSDRQRFADHLGQRARCGRIIITRPTGTIAGCKRARWIITIARSARRTPAKYIRVEEGQMVYTPSMEEHAMVFTAPTRRCGASRAIRARRQTTNRTRCACDSIVPVKRHRMSDTAVQVKDTCRLCQSKALEFLFALAPTPPANEFLSAVPARWQAGPFSARCLSMPRLRPRAVDPLRRSGAAFPQLRLRLRHVAGFREALRGLRGGGDPLRASEGGRPRARLRLE